MNAKSSAHNLREPYTWPRISSRFVIHTPVVFLQELKIITSWRSMNAHFKNRRLLQCITGTLIFLAYIPITQSRSGRFIIYIDDMASKDVASFSVFEQRFFRGLPQLEPVMNVFAEVVTTLCDQYDTLAANAILTATFEFINSNCMEPAIESVPLIRDAGRFPWYLRDQTGIGKAYALMAFPKSRQIALTVYIQAVPDMNYWIAAINDFLSSVSFLKCFSEGNFSTVPPGSTRKS
jgi:hypothetical protein